MFLRGWRAITISRAAPWSSRSIPEAWLKKQVSGREVKSGFDVIVAANGKKIDVYQDMVTILKELKSGQSVVSNCCGFRSQRVNHTQHLLYQPDQTLNAMQRAARQSNLPAARALRNQTEFGETQKRHGFHGFHRFNALVADDHA